MGPSATTRALKSGSGRWGRVRVRGNRGHGGQARRRAAGLAGGRGHEPRSAGASSSREGPGANAPPEPAGGASPAAPHFWPRGTREECPTWGTAGHSAAGAAWALVAAASGHLATSSRDPSLPTPCTVQTPLDHCRSLRGPSEPPPGGPFFTRPSRGWPDAFLSAPRAHTVEALPRGALTLRDSGCSGPLTAPTGQYTPLVHIGGPQYQKSPSGAPRPEAQLSKKVGDDHPQASLDDRRGNVTPCRAHAHGTRVLTPWSRHSSRKGLPKPPLGNRKVRGI